MRKHFNSSHLAEESYLQASSHSNLAAGRLTPTTINNNNNNSSSNNSSNPNSNGGASRLNASKYNLASSRQQLMSDEMSQELTYLSREAPLDGGESTLAAPSYSQLGGMSEEPHEDTFGQVATLDERSLSQLKADNVDIRRAPLKQAGFLVSFMVDARGGAMRGCRHSGVRVIIPSGCAQQPMRITCRYLRRERLVHPPPLMEGEACASRIMEVGPAGAKFLGPVLIEVPHFASLGGEQEREIIVLRSDNGQVWREHVCEFSGPDEQDEEQRLVESIIRAADEQEALDDNRENNDPHKQQQQNYVIDSADESLLSSLHQDHQKSPDSSKQAERRLTRIVTHEFPQYFAIISRVRQQSHSVGPDGLTVSSESVPKVQAIFTEGALTKRIKIGLQKKDQRQHTSTSTSTDNQQQISTSQANQQDESPLAHRRGQASSSSKRRSRKLLACFGAKNQEDGSQTQLDESATSQQVASSSGPSSVDSGHQSPVTSTPVSLKGELRRPSQLVPEDYYKAERGQAPLILNLEPTTYGKRLASSAVQTDRSATNANKLSTYARPKKRSRNFCSRKQKSNVTIDIEDPSIEPSKTDQDNNKKSQPQDPQQAPTESEDEAKLAREYLARSSSSSKWRTCLIQTDSDSVTIQYVTIAQNPNPILDKDNDYQAAAATGGAGGAKHGQDSGPSSVPAPGDDGYVSGSGGSLDKTDPARRSKSDKKAKKSSKKLDKQKKEAEAKAEKERRKAEKSKLKEEKSKTSKATSSVAVASGSSQQVEPGDSAVAVDKSDKLASSSKMQTEAPQKEVTEEAPAAISSSLKKQGSQAAIPEVEVKGAEEKIETSQDLKKLENESSEVKDEAVDASEATEDIVSKADSKKQDKKKKKEEEKLKKKEEEELKKKAKKSLEEEKKAKKKRAKSPSDEPSSSKSVASSSTNKVEAEADQVDEGSESQEEAIASLANELVAKTTDEAIKVSTEKLAEKSKADKKAAEQAAKEAKKAEKEAQRAAKEEAKRVKREAAAATGPKQSFLARIFGSKSKTNKRDAEPIASGSSEQQESEEDSEEAKRRREKKKKQDGLIISEMYPDDSKGELVLEVSMPKSVIEDQLKEEVGKQLDRQQQLQQVDAGVHRARNSMGSLKADDSLALAASSSIEQSLADQEPTTATISERADDTLVNVSQLPTSSEPVFVNNSNNRSRTISRDDDDETQRTRGTDSGFITKPQQQLAQDDVTEIETENQFSATEPLTDVDESQADEMLAPAVDKAPEPTPLEPESRAGDELAATVASDASKLQPTSEAAVAHESQAGSSKLLSDEKSRKELESKLKKEAEKRAKEERELAKREAKEAAKRLKEEKKLAEAERKREEADLKKRTLEEAKRVKEEEKKQKKLAKEEAKAAKKNKKVASASASPTIEVTSSSSDPSSKLTGEVVASSSSKDNDGEQDQLAKTGEIVSDNDTSKPLSAEEIIASTPEYAAMVPVKEESETKQIVEETVDDEGYVTRVTKTLETKTITLRSEETQVIGHEGTDIDVDSVPVPGCSKHDATVVCDDDEQKKPPRELPAELIELCSAPSCFEAIEESNPKLLDPATSERKRANLFKKELKKRVKLNDKLIKRALGLAKRQSKVAKTCAKQARAEVPSSGAAAKLAQHEAARAKKLARKASKLSLAAHKKMDKVDKKLAKQQKKIDKKQEKLDKKAAKAAEKLAKKQAKETKKREALERKNSTRSKKSIKIEDIGEPKLKSASRMSLGSGQPMTLGSGAVLTSVSGVSLITNEPATRTSDSIIDEEEPIIDVCGLGPTPPTNRPAKDKNQVHGDDVVEVHLEDTPDQMTGQSESLTIEHHQHPAPVEQDQEPDVASTRSPAPMTAAATAIGEMIATQVEQTRNFFSKSPSGLDEQQKISSTGLNEQQSINQSVDYQDDQKTEDVVAPSPEPAIRQSQQQQQQLQQQQQQQTAQALYNNSSLSDQVFQPHRLEEPLIEEPEPADEAEFEEQERELERQASPVSINRQHENVKSGDHSHSSSPISQLVSERVESSLHHEQLEEPVSMQSQQFEHRQQQQSSPLSSPGEDVEFFQKTPTVRKSLTDDDQQDDGRSSEQQHVISQARGESSAPEPTMAQYIQYQAEPTSISPTLMQQQDHQRHDDDYERSYNQSGLPEQLQEQSSGHSETFHVEAQQPHYDDLLQHLSSNANTMQSPPATFDVTRSSFEAGDNYEPQSIQYNDDHLNQLTQNDMMMQGGGDSDFQSLAYQHVEQQPEIVHAASRDSNLVNFSPSPQPIEHDDDDSSFADSTSPEPVYMGSNQQEQLQDDYQQQSDIVLDEEIRQLPILEPLHSSEQRESPRSPTSMASSTSLSSSNQQRQQMQQQASPEPDATLISLEHEQQQRDSPSQADD